MFDRLSFLNPFKGLSSVGPQNNASINGPPSETTSKAIDRMLTQFLNTSDTKSGWVIGTSKSDGVTRQRYKAQITREVRDFLTKKVPGPHSKKTPAEAVAKLVDLLSKKTYLPLSRENFFKDAAIAAANEYRCEITSAMSVDTGRVYPHDTTDLAHGENPLFATLSNSSVAPEGGGISCRFVSRLSVLT